MKHLGLNNFILLYIHSNKVSSCLENKTISFLSNQLLTVGSAGCWIQHCHPRFLFYAALHVVLAFIIATVENQLRKDMTSLKRMQCSWMFRLVWCLTDVQGFFPKFIICGSTALLCQVVLGTSACSLRMKDMQLLSSICIQNSGRQEGADRRTDSFYLFSQL